MGSAQVGEEKKGAQQEVEGAEDQIVRLRAFLQDQDDDVVDEEDESERKYDDDHHFHQPDSDSPPSVAQSSPIRSAPIISSNVSPSSSAIRPPVSQRRNPTRRVDNRIKPRESTASNQMTGVPAAIARAPPSFTEFVNNLTQPNGLSTDQSSTERPLENTESPASADSGLIASATLNDPQTLDEALSRSDSKRWEEACKEEMDSIERAGTWTLVPLPEGRTAIGSKWVLKTKLKADNSIDRYKARLVAKGYSQLEGIDFNETFSPVAKFASIRALLALAAYHDLEIHQMDVKSAFLNGDLEEEIYMQQPPGFISKGQEHLVCKLNKSLYGLKQAGRAWYAKIDATLVEQGFKRSEADHCIYFKQMIVDDKPVIFYISVYVDDFLLFSNSVSKMNELKKTLARLYEMKDLGEAEYILGIQIERDRPHRRISICQTGYIQTLLEKFNMTGCKTAYTPLEPGTKLSKADAPSNPIEKEAMKAIPYQSAVGAIMYCMLGTRPDIAFAITALSQFCSNYGRTHWEAVKRVLRYLSTTQHYKLTYGGTQSRNGPLFFGYCDADWGNDPDDRRSFTGYSFLINGGAVSWQSKKQPTTALSSVEAEYMSATQAVKEATWWRTFFSEININVENPIQILTDSKGSIALAKNPEHHSRTKHIDIRHHFIREQVASKAVEMVFVGTASMGADVLTKPIGKTLHHRMIKLLGLCA